MTGLTQERLYGTFESARVARQLTCPIIDGSTTLFTVSGGPIVIEELVGYCSVDVGGAANAHIDANTTAPAATTALSSDVAVTTLVEGSTVTFTVAAPPVLTVTVNGAVANLPAPRWLMTPGTLTCHTSAAQTGNIQWFMRYKPLSPSSVVS